jgi:hypothetical protein
VDFNKIDQLSENDRYYYFIEEVKKSKEIWLLQASDGFFAMVEDESGQQYVPVWPSNAFASTYATGDWDGYIPEKMNLLEFLEWMKELKNDQILIGVFPNSEFQAIPADPIEIGQVLKA